jgi:fructosamine-3-kinase
VKDSSSPIKPFTRSSRPSPRSHSPGADTKVKGSHTISCCLNSATLDNNRPIPKRLTLRLAQLHRSSFFPTGKFGFHTTTCHAKLHQLTELWEDSWETCYRKQLAHMFDLDRERLPRWPQFRAVTDLILDVCVPTLLHPLQSDGRTIEPCLVHGNIWDENTATDVETGEPFVFDGSAMYAHNEYELGNWRTPRHRLSSRSYIRNYKKYFPASEPGEFCCNFFLASTTPFLAFRKTVPPFSLSFFLPHLLVFLFALSPSLHV